MGYAADSKQVAIDGSINGVMWGGIGALDEAS